MQASTQTSLRVTPCVVSDRTFCFDGQKILGMLDSKTCRGVQDDNTDENAIGTIEFEQQPVPVYDLSDLLNLPPGKNGENGSVVVIAQTASGPRGFVVDDALRTRDPLRLTRLSPACRNTSHPFFNGVVTWEAGNSISEKREEVTLRFCVDGLVGSSPSTPSSFTEDAVDVKQFSQMVGDRRRQLMLFDVPHQDWENQVVSVGLSVTQVLEIITPQSLIEVPRSPEGTLGIVQWRNYFVPLVDLTRQLSLGSIPESARSRIVIARDATNLFAFYTSTSVRTLAKPLANAKAIDMGPISQSRWAKGTFRVSEDVIVIPELAV